MNWDIISYLLVKSMMGEIIITETTLLTALMKYHGLIGCRNLLKAAALHTLKEL